MAKETIKVDCPKCGTRIQAPIAGSIVLDAKGHSDPNAFILTHCEDCDLPILARNMLDYEEGWPDYAERIWPDSFEDRIPYDVPHDIRKDLINAQRCLTSKIPDAAAVLAGKAVERWVRQTSGEEYLAKGLKTLRDAGTIDQRLFEWGEALREERNIGAHADDVGVKMDDARDVIDFAIAIFDYVFILSTKFEAYKNRKPNKTLHPTAGNAPV